MDQTSLWTVDKLAATKLLAALGLDITDEQIDRVARHFAQHRQDLTSWAAERAQSSIVRTLETASPDMFVRESDQWASGFRFAEQLVMTANPQELLDLGPERPLSKGRILRSMVRQARRE
jgi:hypothetical protein